MRLLVTIVLWFCLSTAAWSHSAQKRTPIYTLMQESTFSGKHYVVISREGMQVSTPGMGYELQYISSKEKVIIRRPAAHDYAELDASYFVKKFQNVVTSMGFMADMKTPVSQTTMIKDGTKIIRYEFANISDTPGFWRAEVGSHHHNENVRAYMETAVLPVGENAGLILQKLYGAPLLSGIPLNIYCKSTSNRHQGLKTKTLKCDKNGLPPRALDCTGYKKVKFYAQMLAPSLPPII